MSDDDLADPENEIGTGRQSEDYFAGTHRPGIRQPADEREHGGGAGQHRLRG